MKFAQLALLLFFHELTRIEFIVIAFLAHQRLMGSFFQNFSVLHDDDLISMYDRG